MVTIFKVIVTLVILIPTVLTVVWLWRTQIDPVQTAKNLFKKKTDPSIGWVATRDDNKLYQNGLPVADITGPIEDKLKEICFKELSNCNFNKAQVLEYGYKKIRILTIGQRTGILTVMDSEGHTVTKSNVSTDVRCELAEDLK